VNDKKESIFRRLYAWLRANIACRFGRHDMHKVFADDELPNPEYCIYCGAVQG